MKRVMLAGMLSIIIIITTACGQSFYRYNYPVQPFDYTNQDDQRVSLSDLEGKVWIADLVFTYCETICPTMSANMAELQKRLKSEGVEVELISFSVDPERDDPAALKQYLEKFDADFSNWNALTGYEFHEIKSFVLRSFKTTIGKDTASDQVIHDANFNLVDQSGHVVAKYDGMNPPYTKIIKKVKDLQK
ncbi:SCO family protein [Paenibacillus sp. 598K]|uniref:SCO family protein n=1 Tax=Paenibacillus sp. 598K TaxID=1117987 RepID=UPI000FF9A5AF|nr:SCO family protein [Paenibacillus sp. 598K]GBF77770.1 SCO family protein [Paenibacillus sp. 598K]